MKKILLIGTLVGVLSGCSTIVSKSEYAVVIASNPDTANFTVVNKSGKQVHSGITPDTVTLKASSGFFRGEAYTVTFNKEGYPEKKFTMKSSVDGWYFGNILFGGLIGMLIVDPITGAMYNLPERVDVSLEKAVSKHQKNQIIIASIETLSIEERSQLVAIK